LKSTDHSDEHVWLVRDLNALFEELVRQSGSISEQEFWAGRQHLLRKQQGESGAHKQRAGVGNVMLLGMRPSADGRTNTVSGASFTWLSYTCGSLHPCINIIYHEAYASACVKVVPNMLRQSLACVEGLHAACYR